MSEEEKRVHTHDVPTCPRCKTVQMVEIVSIAPAGHEPGLIGYECPRCGYVTSVIQPSLKRGTRLKR
jgi:phage FluMu protein Com